MEKVLRNSAEYLLYFLASLLLNLLFFKVLFHYLFAFDYAPREFYPVLKVEIKEVAPPKPKAPPPPPPVKKKPKKEAPPPSAGVASASQEGQVPVKVEEEEKKEEEVSILSQLKEKVMRRVEERRRAVKEVGEISAVVKEKGVEIRAGTRKLLSVPPAPTFSVREFPSAVKVKIWVSPEGRVIKALIVQRSGVAEIDNELLKFVKKLRFEPVEGGEVQVGTVVFTFATS
ncbi:MAG: energy transducer TonB [Aquificae bacterium]|nr:energy transducer TonB [Aquificota bacterium]